MGDSRTSDQIIKQLEARVAELEKAEAGLLEKAKWFWTLYEKAPDPVFMETMDDRIIDANGEASRVFGYTREEFKKMTIADLQAPEVRGQPGSILKNELDRGEYFEGINIDKKGNRIPIEVHNRLIIHDGKQMVLSVVRDIRHRKAVEKNLRLHEAVTSSVAEPIAVIDRDYHFLMVNKSYENFWSLDKKEIIGRLVPEVIGEDIFEKKIKEKIDACLAGKIINFSSWVDLPVYGRRYISSNHYPFRRKDGRITGMVNISYDLTDKITIENKLRESEELFRTLIESAPLSVMVLRNGKYIYGNKYIRDLLGFERSEDFIGLDALQSIAPEYHETVLNRMSRLEKGLENPPVELRFIKADNSSGWVMSTCVQVIMSGKPAILVVGQDITELKQMTEQKERLEGEYRQAQKLESIGRLAGGVAHDLNNMLSPILGYGEMLVEDCTPGDSRREAAEQIVIAAEKAGNLIRQLLAFSRKQALEFKDVDLVQLLTDFKKLITRTIREDIRFEMILPASLPLIRGDVGQLEQIIMNLVVNAQDAITGSGEITVALAHMDRKSQSTSRGMIKLSVRDNGQGIDNIHRDRIFEPFFTTKEKDKGTGLGLATVYGIVKQHGGTIDVESRPGKGTVFTVLFPESKHQKLPPMQTSDRDDASHLNRTILVVEDERPLREMVGTALKRKGYKVVLAENGSQALDYLQSARETIDLMITDVVMPGIDGRQLAEKVISMQPDIRVLYVSGYIDDEIVRRGVMEQKKNFLRKPFSLKELDMRVIDLLCSDHSFKKSDQ